MHSPGYEPVVCDLMCTLQDMSHEDEEVQHGDVDSGMDVSPGLYLSDSDLSVTSIELSPAQVGDEGGSGSALARRISAVVGRDRVRRQGRGSEPEPEPGSGLRSNANARARSVVRSGA